MRQAQRPMSDRFAGLLAWLVVAIAPGTVAAHGFHAGTAQVTVNGKELAVELTLPAPDFLHFFNISTGPDGAATGGALGRRADELTRYVDSRFYMVWKEHQCERVGPWGFRIAGDGHEALVAITAPFGCVSPPEELKVVNRLLFERSGGMRHAVEVTSGGRSQQQVFNPSADSHVFEVSQARVEEGGFPILQVTLSAIVLLVAAVLFLWLRKKAADAVAWNR